MSLENEIYSRIGKLGVKATVVNLSLQSMRDDFIARHPNYKAYNVNDTDSGWAKLAALIPENAIVGLCWTAMRTVAEPEADPVYHTVVVAPPDAENE